MVLRWVIRGGNTCQGMKIYRGETDVAENQIGLISGICGSTDSDETYEYVDSSAIANIFNYYRIEFGTQGLSEPVGVFFKRFGNDDVLVLPDPINDRAQILFDNQDHHSAMLLIVNTLGQIVDRKSTVSEEFDVRMNGWKDGLYYFQIVVNGEKKTGKLFKF